VTRHVVARAAELPPGTRKRVSIENRDIVVLNIKGELFALSDKCPHRGASLSGGLLTGLVKSDGPRDYKYERAGEILRCPWHQWEFDVRTGRSYCDPRRLRLMQFPVAVEPGASVVEGPYKAETFSVSVEDDYIVLDSPQ
jgi:3-phenylpropionate/trans-cinnamate dioxygenase ferredoxin subunit